MDWKILIPSTALWYSTPTTAFCGAMSATICRLSLELCMSAGKPPARGNPQGLSVNSWHTKAHVRRPLTSRTLSRSMSLRTTLPVRQGTSVCSMAQRNISERTMRPRKRSTWRRSMTAPWQPVTVSSSEPHPRSKTGSVSNRTAI